MSARIEEIENIIQANPKEPFPRYGLAMEYKNLGLWQKAHEAFVTLEEMSPQYVPQYLMHGQLLLAMKDIKQARRVFEQGLVQAEKARNHHAASELSQALSQLEDSDDLENWEEN